LEPARSSVFPVGASSNPQIVSSPQVPVAQSEVQGTHRAAPAVSSHLPADLNTLHSSPELRHSDSLMPRVLNAGSNLSHVHSSP
jgi:hypothetical protein